MKEGWYYVFVFALLIYMLLIMRREALAPYYATPLLILLNQLFSARHRWGWKEVGRFFDALGALFANLVAILAAVGMIVGALSMTGVAATLVNNLLRIAGGSPILLLVMGAITGLILGTGMTSTAAYIFLAILFAPALVEVGLNPMAVHMFIFYWGMLSFITPPVALGAFAAASIAKTSPMQTGFEAMRFGSVIYFIPFFFAFQPAWCWKAPSRNDSGIRARSRRYLSLCLGAPGLHAARRCRVRPQVVRLAASDRPARGRDPHRLAGDGRSRWSDFDLVVLAAVFAVPIIMFAAFLNRGVKPNGLAKSVG